MANIVNVDENNLDVSLDGVLDFDWTTDCGQPAPMGARIKAIRMDPSAVGDEVIVRNGANGPRLFRAEAIDVYDTQIQYYSGSDLRNVGKPVTPYIHANECTIGVPNQCFIYFDLGG